MIQSNPITKQAGGGGGGDTQLAYNHSLTMCVSTGVPTSIMLVRFTRKTFFPSPLPLLCAQGVLACKVNIRCW